MSLFREKRLPLEAKAHFLRAFLGGKEGRGGCDIEIYLRINKNVKPKLRPFSIVNSFIVKWV